MIIYLCKVNMHTYCILYIDRKIIKSFIVIKQPTENFNTETFYMVGYDYLSVHTT